MAGVDNKAYDGDVHETQPESSAVLGLENQGSVKIGKNGKIKVPRKVLHCSDGIYEEYSTDEEEEEPKPVIDPRTLTWGPYIWYLTTKTAYGGLAVCDFLGEKLAWFFGITSPRYQYAIDEVKRMQEEEKEQEDQEREEREAELQFVHSSLAMKSNSYGTTQSDISVNDVDVTEKAEAQSSGDI